MRSSWIIPRRSFLARISAWAAACVTLPSLRPAAAAGNSPVNTPFGGPIDRTTAALFEQHLNSAFRIVPDPRTAAPRSVVLTDVTRSEIKIVTGRRAPSSTPAFSLIFRDAEGRALPQNTYRVEHPQIGVFPLFLVPIGPKRANVVYQAVFA